MAKKTIGLNPLEEYLSAPKNPRKEPEKAVAKKVAEEPKKVVKPKATPMVEEPIVEATPTRATPDKAVPAQVEPPTLTDDVEVDGQGQLAIKGTKVPEVKKERPAKQRITLHISTELVDRIKNAVYWEPGLTVAGFAEEAFTDAIDTLEKERGEPFPQRKHHRLRGGRPVS